MAKVFLSPYTSNLLSHDDERGCAKTYAPLHKALERGEWPYDYGDDPSFFCRRTLEANLTWGVCRADVRAQVEPGDVVVFFAFTKRDHNVEYRLSAIATVEHKIRQTDIWQQAAYAGYRRYLNLLIKPGDGDGRRWVHEEPGSPKKYWHKDWLGRVATFRGYSKEELSRQAALEQVTLGTSIGGRPFSFGYNYILFSNRQESTFVVASPPVAAFAVPPESETWLNSPVAKLVQRFTILEAKSRGVERGLRLENKRLQPHSPPIRWQDSATAVERWRREFIESLTSAGVEPC